MNVRIYEFIITVQHYSHILRRVYKKVILFGEVLGYSIKLIHSVVYIAVINKMRKSPICAVYQKMRQLRVHIVNTNNH